jgi:hypothetical protein
MSSLGATSLATSITLFIHPLTIFNITRYIKLTYTTLAILLEIVVALLAAVAITSATTRKTNHIPQLVGRKLITEYGDCNRKQ